MTHPDIQTEDKTMKTLTREQIAAFLSDVQGVSPNCPIDGVDAFLTAFPGPRATYRNLRIWCGY